MWNRHKTLLRDHSVPEVTLKACLKHYSVSAIPETLTIRGPKRPPKILDENVTTFEEGSSEIGGDGRRGGYNPIDNPPTIVLFLGKSISKCQGCLGTIKRDV